MLPVVLPALDPLPADTLLFVVSCCVTPPVAPAVLPPDTAQAGDATTAASARAISDFLK